MSNDVSNNAMIRQNVNGISSRSNFEAHCRGSRDRLWHRGSIFI